MTIDNHEVVGLKVLIKLEAFKDTHTVNTAGIIIPQFDNYETDGGRPASKIKAGEGTEFSTIGKIVQIPKEAQKLLEDKGTTLEVGEYVSIPYTQLHPMNQFLVERDQKVASFDGYMLIHPDMIQSKINNFNGLN